MSLYIFSDLFLYLIIITAIIGSTYCQNLEAHNHHKIKPEGFLATVNPDFLEAHSQSSEAIARKSHFNISNVYPFSKASVVSFIVVYHGSQGSTWFMDALSEFTGVCVIGNELIDRIKSPDKRIQFIEQASQSPSSSNSTKSWKDMIFGFATDPPSWYDKQMLSKCTGNETAFGFKARLSFDEIKYIFSDDTQRRLDIRVIVLNRNPVKQALSAYRRDFEAHDQRLMNMLADEANKHCQNRQPSNPFCKSKVDELNEAKNHKSAVNFENFQNEMGLHLYYYAERDRQFQSILNGSQQHTNLLFVAYEKMMEDMDGLMLDTVLPFLGISRAHPDATKDMRKVSKGMFRTKATQDLMCDAVSNFSSMCEYVRTAYMGTGLVGPDRNTVLGYLNADACLDSQYSSAPYGSAPTIFSASAPVRTQRFLAKSNSNMSARKRQLEAASDSLIERPKAVRSGGPGVASTAGSTPTLRASVAAAKPRPVSPRSGQTPLLQSVTSSSRTGGSAILTANSSHASRDGHAGESKKGASCCMKCCQRSNSTNPNCINRASLAANAAHN